MHLICVRSVLWRHLDGQQPIIMYTLYLRWRQTRGLFPDYCHSRAVSGLTPFPWTATNSNSRGGSLAYPHAARTEKKAAPNLHALVRVPAPVYVRATNDLCGHHFAVAELQSGSKVPQQWQRRGNAPAMWGGKKVFWRACTTELLASVSFWKTLPQSRIGFESLCVPQVPTLLPTSHCRCNSLGVGDWSPPSHQTLCTPSVRPVLGVRLTSP